MKKSGPNEGEKVDSPSQLIEARIRELSDWRGETLARVRSVIKQVDPEVVESASDIQFSIHDNSWALEPHLDPRSKQPTVER